MVLVLVLLSRSAGATGGAGRIGPGAASGASARHALPREGSHGSVRPRLSGPQRPGRRRRSGSPATCNLRSCPRRSIRRCPRGTWPRPDHLGRSALRIPWIARRKRSAPPGSVTQRGVRRSVSSSGDALEPLVPMGPHRATVDVGYPRATQCARAPCRRPSDQGV